MELPNTKVIQNQEVKNLMVAIGLKMGEEPNNLRFGKLLLYTDMDPDGDSIAGLLMNFFGKYWPELFTQHRICRVMTPLVVVKKGKETKIFYTTQEFQEWESQQKSLNQWEVEYKKGLAALEDEEYQEIIQNPKMITIERGDHFQETLSTWFAADSLPRKLKILGISQDEFEDKEAERKGPSVPKVEKEKVQKPEKKEKPQKEKKKEENKKRKPETVQLF